MKLDTFIKRPVLSTVISILIVLVGVLAALSLPMEKYPDIAPPTINISTTYSGANSETLIKSVITPIEDAVNGVENMIYMNSTASNTGQVSIDVVFKQGTNPDMAAMNVQNRVNQATPMLPAEVKNFGVKVEKSQNSMLQAFCVYSPDDRYDLSFLSNFASLSIKPNILLVNGIGKFEILSTDYSMRIWLKPDVLAQYKISTKEVINALASQNIEAATGSFGENSDETYQYAMRYTGRLKSVEEFNNIIIRVEEDGTILRLNQVARVELGQEHYSFKGICNGHPGVTCIAYQCTGSNATQVNNDISKVLEEVKKTAPEGVEIVTLSNTNDFLYAAIGQVAGTLRDAIILVILIVLMFLKDFRSTMIPFISIMVSLIGTFAFMTVAGFSINLLTLFALVLVIGTVVDDSIVVVEAVHAKFEEGVLDPYKATSAAVKEVAMPVITSSLVFMAVFVPVSFMGGTSGVFYSEFGLTMAVAVGISALNALTLVPALCAMMLSPLDKLKEGQKPTFKQRYARWFDGLFEKFSKSYTGGLAKIINKKAIIWFFSAVGLAGVILLLTFMPSGLVPDEDQGLLVIETSTPPGSSLSYTYDIMSRLSEKIGEIDGVEAYSSTAGFGFISGYSSSSSLILIKLEHWDVRAKKGVKFADIYQQLFAITKEVPEATSLVFALPMITGYGNNNGIDMYVQDRRGGSIQELYDVTADFVSELRKRGLFGYMSFNMDYPQWEVSVDVAKCMRSGLSPKDVLDEVGAYFGGQYISDINLYSKVYKVMIQADPDARRDEMSLNRIQIPVKDGSMAPLSSFVSIKRTYGPESIKTFNKFQAINVSVTSGMTTGEALKTLHEVAEETLPSGYTIDFAGMAREQDNQGSLGLILILCTFIIYLILAALYESWVIPFSILLTVPLGLAGSFAATALVGLDNNIYVQTGVIMLIGLLSKTGILITEYAVERHRQGMSITDAAIEAAGVRLRPIIMTVATMVIGLFPLVASVGGVGGRGNFSLGLGTIVGMIIGPIGLLYIVPSLYTVFQKIQDKSEAKKKKFEDEEA